MGNHGDVYSPPENSGYIADDYIFSKIFEVRKTLPQSHFKCSLRARKLSILAQNRTRGAKNTPKDAKISSGGSIPTAGNFSGGGGGLPAGGIFTEGGIFLAGWIFPSGGGTFPAGNI